MTDSKITPAASSTASGAPSAINQKGGGPLSNAQTAQVLLQNASVRNAPQDLRNPAQNLRLDGRVIASNPAGGEIRIATDRGEITLQSTANLSPDTQVSIDLHMQGDRETATVMLQRVQVQRPVQDTPEAPDVPAPVATRPAAPLPPLSSGDSVTAIRIPEEAQASPPPPAPAEGIARAAVIIESLGPQDFATLPKPLPLPTSTAVQIATAPDVAEALANLPPEQQQAVLNYLARPDVAAKLQTILPPAILNSTGEVIDQNMTDIVAAQAASKLAPEGAPAPTPVLTGAPQTPTSQIPTALAGVPASTTTPLATTSATTLQDAPSQAPAQTPPPAAPAPASPLRGLLPLLEAMQSAGNAPGLMPKMQMPAMGTPFVDQMPENMFEVNIASVTAPGLPAPAPAAGQLQGEVESVTQTGLPVIRAGGDLFILKTQSPVAPGSIVTFTATALSLRETMEALTVKLTAAPWQSFNINSDTGFQPLLGDEWPALQSALQNLAGTSAEAAMRNTIPTATARLVPTTLFFLAALRAGDVESWLGANALQLLKSSGKQNLIDRLSGDFAKISSGAKEPLPGDWRGISIPLLQDEQISQMQLYLRHQQMDDDQGNNGGGDDKTVTTRFLLNLHLSRMGDMQLDGLMKKQRLDLILRSRDALPAPMRQELMQSFQTGLAQTGLEGGISFQAKLQGWVTVELPHQGTVI